MPANKTGLIVPKFGALFTAAEGTNPIADIAAFTLAAGPVGAVWYHWGHLSRENPPESSSDGGDVTTLSTWLEMNTDSETAEAVDSFTYSLVQNDAVTIAAMAALNGQKVSALELWFSGTKRFASWFPSCKVALSGRPGLNGVDQYAESKMALTILAPPTALNLASLADPANGIAPWPNATTPNTLYFDNGAFA